MGIIMVSPNNTNLDLQDMIDEAVAQAHDRALEDHAVWTAENEKGDCPKARKWKIVAAGLGVATLMFATTSCVFMHKFSLCRGRKGTKIDKSYLEKDVKLPYHHECKCNKDDCVTCFERETGITINIDGDGNMVFIDSDGNQVLQNSDNNTLCSRIQKMKNSPNAKQVIRDRGKKKPCTPSTPSTPSRPGTPSTPSTPGTPSRPGTPSTPTPKPPVEQPCIDKPLTPPSDHHQGGASNSSNEVIITQPPDTTPPPRTETIEIINYEDDNDWGQTSLNINLQYNTPKGKVLVRSA